MGEVEHTGDDLAAVGWVLHLPGADKRLHQQQAAAALRQHVGGAGQVQQVWAGVLDGQIQLVAAQLHQQAKLALGVDDGVGDQFAGHQDGLVDPVGQPGALVGVVGQV